VVYTFSRIFFLRASNHEINNSTNTHHDMRCTNLRTCIHENTIFLYQTKKIGIREFICIHSIILCLKVYIWDY